MQSAKPGTIKHDANAQQALKATLEAFAKEVSQAHNFLNQYNVGHFNLFRPFLSFYFCSTKRRVRT